LWAPKAAFPHYDLDLGGRMRAVLALAVVAGCGPRAEVSLTRRADPAAPVDLRRAFPPPPEGGAQLVTPEYVIEPSTEVEWCWFSTWTGPTTGLRAQWTYQSPHGHHVVVNATSAPADAYPDGSALDCTDPGALPMTDLQPLLIGGTGNAETPDGPESELVLPDGMAVRLQEGQRIVLQSHYVNTTAEPILVQDALNLALVDPDAVATWTAPFVHLDVDLAVARGHHALEFDCAWQQEVDLLFLAGHLHEHGSAYALTLTPADGGPPRALHEVAEWDPAMRDVPPVTEYAPGELTIHPGDLFTTRCEWDNETDHVLGFPEEMCVTFGMAYPLEAPIVCASGGVAQP
jgi:hypothetical protein